MFTDDYGSSDDHNKISLRTLCYRSISHDFFHQNTYAFTCDRLSIPARVQDYIRDQRLPHQVRKPLLKTLNLLCEEIQRWWSKHAALFPVQTYNKRPRADRSEHLKLFYHCLTWHPFRASCIDDYATAQKIIAENEDWPRFVFQFACAYAMEKRVKQFDEIYLRTFQGKLSDHPLFDFWFFLRASIRNPFEYVGLTPRIVVVAAFDFAATHGYLEMVSYIWCHVMPQQREFLGMTHWRQQSAKLLYFDMFQFLVKELYEVNPIILSRITAQIFISKVKECATHRHASFRERGRPKPLMSKKFGRQTSALANFACGRTTHPTETMIVADKDHAKKVISFLLEHCPRDMIDFMLEYEQYFSFIFCARHKDVKTFRFLVTNLSPHQKLPLVDELKKELTGPLLDTTLRIVATEMRLI